MNDPDSPPGERELPPDIPGYSLREIAGAGAICCVVMWGLAVAFNYPLIELLGHTDHVSRRKMRDAVVMFLVSVAALPLRFPRRRSIDGRIWGVFRDLCG